jgi:hypothetical protein
MHDDRTVVVNKENAASPVAWVIGVAIVVAAVLFVLFYWHPWSTTSTTNTTTITQPGTNGGSTQRSDSTSNSVTQP